jgi:hypothetical protein
MGYIGSIDADGTADERSASTDALDSTYLQASIADQREHTDAVPGAGDILGCVTYNRTDYAFRNNSGGTAAIMWKATSTGWVQVTSAYSIQFDTGTDEIVTGDVLTGQTSGATCTVTAVHLESGTWAGNDAAGYIHFTTFFGTFSVGEKITTTRLSPTTSADVTVANTEDAFQPSGQFEFEIDNFGGHAGTIKLYGVDGVSNGFEFDGTNIIPIHTGMTTDTPSHVIAHKKHLFYMFSGGSIQHSGIGTPHVWSAVTGAAELGLGDEGTGFEKVPGGQLAIFTRNKTYILQGTSVANWVLVEHSEVSGAIEWSIQRLAYPIYLDDRGVTSLNAVQDFGDFKDNVISDLVQPYLDTRTDAVQTSMIVREKNQYRLFFDDNTALYFTFRNHKLIGTTRVDLGKKVTAAWSGEDSTGEERLLIGSTDGYLYRLDSGTSLDGTELQSYMRTPYHNYGSPGYYKRFFSITLELDLQEQISTNLELFPDFTYADNEAPPAAPQTVDPGPGGGVWGDASWGRAGSIAWGGALVSEGFAHIDGYGRNLGILIASAATYEEPHTVNGATVEFAVKNKRR